jgi:hypothetical protein
LECEGRKKKKGREIIGEQGEKRWEMQADQTTWRLSVKVGGW